MVAKPRVGINSGGAIVSTGLANVLVRDGLDFGAVPVPL